MSRASADGLTCGKTWKLFCCLINSVPCHCLVSGLWAGLMSKQTETLCGWGPGRVLPLLVVRESFRIDTFPSALVIGSISPAAPLDCVPDSGEDRARKYSVSLLFAGSVLSCPSHSFSPGQIFVVVNSQFRKEDKGLRLWMLLVVRNSIIVSHYNLLVYQEQGACFSCIALLVSGSPL